MVKLAGLPAWWQGGLVALILALFAGLAWDALVTSDVLSQVLASLGIVAAAVLLVFARDARQ